MTGSAIAHSFLPVTAIKVGKQPKVVREIARNIDALAQCYDGKITNLEGNVSTTADLPADDDFILYDSGSADDTDSDDGSSEASENSSQNSESSDNDSSLEDEEPADTSHEIRETFRQYLHSTSEMRVFAPDQTKAIQLLAELRR